jgi:hypothetical protein
MSTYRWAPATEPTLTTPSKVLQAIEGLKVGEAPGPYGIPGRVLRHLPKRSINFPTKTSNSVLRRPCVSAAWQSDPVVPILKPGKDPTLASCCRPIGVLDTVGKLFEEILLTRLLREVNERGQLRDEQFGFRPRPSTRRQLVRLIEMVNGNCKGRRPTGAVTRMWPNRSALCGSEVFRKS